MSCLQRRAGTPATTRSELTRRSFVVRSSFVQASFRYDVLAAPLLHSPFNFELPATGQVKSPPTFSESWHVVANTRLALRVQVEVHRQTYRGEKWFLLRHPYTNAFYRLTPGAYAFVARLAPDRTVESVWKLCLEIDPDGAPGQTEVLQLLAQLHAADLIHSELPADSQALASRREKRRTRERTSWLLNLLFARFSLLNPDPFFRRALPYVRGLYSRAGAVAWVALVFFGLKTVVDHWEALADQSQGVLAPENLPWLYACLVGLALMHECGHGFACRRHGGQVTNFGVILMIFTPLPFVDVSSSWSFREKRHRLLVGAGGMLVELAVASVSALIWANTGGGLVHTLAFNVMFLASVSTLLFNANPLLRFDGYYLLSDALGVPNLYSRAQQQIQFLIDRHLLRTPRARSPATTKGEARYLTVFGFASAAYRLFLLGTILLFVANHYLLLGLIFAAVAFVAWICVPVGKALHFLFTSPALDRDRPGALMRCGAAMALVILPCALVPLPASFTAPGVIESRGYRVVVAEAAGELATLHAPTNRSVAAGDPLFELTNPSLEQDLRAARARSAEAAARFRASLDDGGVNQRTIEQYATAAAHQVERSTQEVAALRGLAPGAGVWHAPDLALQTGRYFRRGAPLGEIIGAEGFDVVAVVSQQDAARLFSDDIKRVRARAAGSVWRALETKQWHVAPGQHTRLPSASLGWTGGGPVEIDSSDPSGVAAREPFFEVRTHVMEDPEVELRHGQTARLHFRLRAQPLFTQVRRWLRQLIQQRYQI
jgi:putative peptide zinc metalloprotease protein